MRKYDNLQHQAQKFLEDINATCTIEYRGRAKNTEWNEDIERNLYYVILTTPLGQMSYEYWDNRERTKLSYMSFKDYLKDMFGDNYSLLPPKEKIKQWLSFTRAKRETTPSVYDALIYLEKYNFTSFEEYCTELKLNYNSPVAKSTYKTVCKQYLELEQIFTQEQLMMLRNLDNLMFEEMEIER